MAKVLTAKGVEAARPDATKRLEIPDGGLTGLYLVVQPSGAKGWACRYRWGGKPRKTTLGRWPGMGVAEARAAARAVLAKVAEGVDPDVERRAAEPDRDTVDVQVEAFLRRHVAGQRTEREVRRIFVREVLPRWRGRDVATLKRRDVIDLIDAIVDRGSPVMANRVLAAVRKWAGWMVGRDVIPASFADGVVAPAAEHKRDRVLSDEELRAVWLAAGELGEPFGPLGRLLILTAARREEVAALRWPELDLTAATWTLPAERAKNGNAIILPLAPAAVEILAARPRIVGCDFVFSSTGRTAVSGLSRAKARLDALIVTAGAPLAPWRFHDLRRTAATGMARLGIAMQVVERLLNHTSGSFGGVAGVYQRHDYAAEKRHAVEVWARHVAAVVGDGEAGNVLELRR